MSIPKTIHYCWFGGNELPESARKCIDSWRRHFPDYEIKRWDESNFDVNINAYTAQAYSIGKYAFVSDYARMWILYHHGGVYFDTDVEVIADFADILAKGGFMGFETPEYVAPGLGMALEKGDSVALAVMQKLEKTQFLNADGSFNPQGIVPATTAALTERGLRRDGSLQRIGDITIYPAEFFNPFDDATGRLRSTSNTRSIHWYSKTWMPKQNPARVLLARLYHRVCRSGCIARIKNLIAKRNV